MRIEQKQSGQGFVMRNFWLLILVAVLLGGIALTVMRGSSNEAELNAQQARVTELESQVATKKQTRTSQVNNSVSQALGVTPSRVIADTAAIQTLMNTIFSWDSGTSYEGMRESVKRRYKLTEKDPFLLQFMPPARFNVDNTGKRYYYIDGAGLRSSLMGDVQVEVVRATGTTYEYAVIARVESKTSLPDQLTARATRLVLMYVTVDGQGRFTQLRGVPPSGLLRTAS